jgi:hypothetical protein
MIDFQDTPVFLIRVLSGEAAASHRLAPRLFEINPRHDVIEFSSRLTHPIHLPQ